MPPGWLAAPKMNTRQPQVWKSDGVILSLMSEYFSNEPLPSSSSDNLLRLSTIVYTAYGHNTVDTTMDHFCLAWNKIFLPP